MCGIIGVMTSDLTAYQRPHTAFFKQALFADTFRGEDSTGIMLLAPNEFKPKTYKRALAAPDFLQLKQVDNLLGIAKPFSLMVGHNRAATKGGIKDHTAHPFQTENITLVHNGTINNHRMLTDGNKFDVDSEAIAHSIEVDGAAATVKAINGAFALVWHDIRDDSVNIIRNSERPLAIGISEDEETLYFASEAPMLQWIAARNGIKLKHIYVPSEGILHQFYIGTENWATKPKVTKLELYKSPVTTTSSRTSTARQETGDVQTRRLVRELGQEGKIVFAPEKWSPYATNSTSGVQRGKLEGKIKGCAKQHSIIVHNVPQEAAVDLLDHILVSTVQYAFETRLGHQGAKTITVNLNLDDLKEYIVDKDNKIVDMQGRPLEKKTRGVSQQKSSGGSSEAGNGNKVDNFDEDDSEVPAVEVPTTDDLVLGPNNEFITHAEFDHLTRHGCCNCGGNIYHMDSLNLDWTDDNQPICVYCTGVLGYNETVH